MFKFILAIFFSLTLFQSFAGEQSVYDFSWLDPDKEIFVLQNRKYQKKSRLHISAGYGRTLSGPFVSSSALQGRMGFFFSERFGIELIYSKNSGSNNSTYEAVLNEKGGGGGSIPFRRVVDNYYGGQLVWSPFYSKINTFNKIVYLDWMFTLGYGRLQEHHNRDAIMNNEATYPETVETHGTLLWGTGLKIFLSRYVDLRIDLTGAVYRAARPGSVTSNGEKGTYVNYDLAIALGIALF